MLRIHPNARTTPTVRVETVRKWRKRGVADCLDPSARPHRLPWKASEEERAVVCALRRATNFPLDDLTFVVAHFLPHLNRDSIWRILESRRAEPAAATRFGAAEAGTRNLQ